MMETKMKKIIVCALVCVAVVFGCQATSFAASLTFTEDFESGVIDPNVWTVVTTGATKYLEIKSTADNDDLPVNANGRDYALTLYARASDGYMYTYMPETVTNSDRFTIQFDYALHYSPSITGYSLFVPTDNDLPGVYAGTGADLVFKGTIQGGVNPSVETYEGGSTFAVLPGLPAVARTTWIRFTIDSWDENNIVALPYYPSGPIYGIRTHHGTPTAVRGNGVRVGGETVASFFDGHVAKIASGDLEDDFFDVKGDDFPNSP